VKPGSRDHAGPLGGLLVLRCDRAGAGGFAVFGSAGHELADAADTLLRPLDPEERGLLRTLLTRIADHWQALRAARPG
jgi:hypothetical protein